MDLRRVRWPLAHPEDTLARNNQGALLTPEDVAAFKARQRRDSRYAVTDIEVDAAMSETETQWGIRLDCAKQGCDPKHADDGHVVRTGPEPHPDSTINNHACVVVTRTVTYTDWCVAGDEPQ